MSLKTLRPFAMEVLLTPPTNYFSCLSILFHLLRDNIRSIYDYCLTRYGMERAKELNAHRVPPQCISGRWAQAGRCEDWLHPWTQAELQAVFENVIMKRSYALGDGGDANAGENADGPAKKKPRAKAKPKAKKAPIDETRNDCSDAFAQLWGGWSKKGAAIVNSKGFWLLKDIRRRVGHRLDRLLWTLEKRREPSKQDSNLSDLVDGKGNRTTHLRTCKRYFACLLYTSDAADE